MPVVIDNVSKRYGALLVLDGFCAELGDTGVTCVMGESGSGKTTLMNILAGLEKPDSGSVRGMDGMRAAMVFQEDRLMEWMSALKNVEFVLGRDSKREAAKHLRDVGLMENAAKRVSQFSGGMKRRTALARALAADSDLLLLDEPFNGLDDKTKRLVMDLVLEAAKSKPVVLITHDANDASKLSGKVYFLPS